ncbi:MAG: DUF4372 domain-containing protein [Sphingobacteriales bacterium]|nr:MAG: DUF4372 domain-containing protein [Sphingobacteriales bacterium]
MDKDRRFPGQPVLSQILDLINAQLINKVARKHAANRYYKRLPLRVHITSLLYGVFRSADLYFSYRKIIDLQIILQSGPLNLHMVFSDCPDIDKSEIRDRKIRDSEIRDQKIRDSQIIYAT